MTTPASIVTLVNTVRALLAGWRQDTRLLRLHVPVGLVSGADALLVEQLSGVETVGEGGFRFDLVALSTQAHLDLKQVQ